MFAEKYRSIGLNILYYRRLKGLSQEALSIKAGLTRSYISKIERGAARCGLEVFFLIAQALEVDPAELISDLPPGTESALKKLYLVTGDEGGIFMNPDYKEIGKNIRLMRIRHGISQSELAQRLDVSQTHMSNLEHGRVSVSLRVLLRLAHFFKCSVDTLLGSVLQGHVVPEVNNDGYDIEDLALLLKVLKQKRVEVM